MSTMLQKSLQKWPRLTSKRFVIGVLLLHITIIAGEHLPNVYIASKSLFDTVCLDVDGNVRNDMDEWMETSCDRRICYSKELEPLSYSIHYDCPPENNVDPDNCEYVWSTALTFPECCGEVQCTTGVLPNTTYPDCYDKSSSFACGFWKNNTNCMSTPDMDSDLLNQYNLTIGNCNKTCGYCV